jgi:hypothetical protein
MKEFLFNLKIIKVNKKLLNHELKEVLSLVKTENKHTIVSNLSPILIKKYFNIISESKSIFLFLLKKKNKVIGYSVYAKKEKYLISDFKKIKLKIFIDLLFKLKFLSLINILLAITKIDLILLSKKDIQRNANSLNLNLLAINKKYQSQGIGKFFVEQTIRIIYKKLYKFNLITCEAPTINALNFYLKKIKFKLIGKKVRLTKNFFILQKKYK